MRVALLLVALLTGCASTDSAIPVEVKYDPPMPRPVQVCDVHWKVLVVDGNPYVALTYEDNINFALCAKDLERYLSEITLVVCQYRQCSKDNNAATTINRHE